jgi:hypothetical protein
MEKLAVAEGGEDLRPNRASSLKKQAGKSSSFGMYARALESRINAAARARSHGRLEVK